MGRRKIGAAFERSPADDLNFWATKNLLVLVSAVITAIIFWFLANVFIDKGLNFLALGSNPDNKIEPFSSDAPISVVCKIVGALLTVFFVCRKTTR
jgi:hypothetical protein